MSTISSSSRAKLKQVQKLIKDQSWEEAVSLSKEVLRDDQGQGQGVYNALVFAGLSLSKLNRQEEAEKVYRQATTLFPEQSLAYQGLAKLYEAQEEWQKLGELQEELLESSWAKSDAVECLRHAQALVQVVQEHGTEERLVNLLEALVPGGRLFDYFASNADTIEAGKAGDGAVGGAQGQAETSSHQYVPWQIPEFPPPPPFDVSKFSLSAPPTTPASFATDPMTHIPRPFPPIRQLLTEPKSSLAALVTLALIIERRQRAAEEKEVTQRRKRLGAGGENAVRKAVGRELLCESELPALWQEIARHPAAEEELRRAVEAKEFRHWLRLLSCLSRNPTSTDSTAPTQQSSVDDALKLFEPKPKTKIAPLKTDVHARVSEIIRGILLIQVPDETAYYLNLEWRDAGGLDQYPLEEIHAYMELFPDSNVSALLESACRYFGWQLPDEEQREKARKRRRRKESKGRGADDEDDLAADGPNEDQLPDPFNVLIGALTQMPKSIFAHRLASEAYLREQDWENLVAVAEKGISLVKSCEIETGEKMPATRAVFDVYLGTALVYYFPPKHHPRALTLLEGVLELDPNAVPCLMGRGTILQAQNRWADARADFQKIYDLETSEENGGDDEAALNLSEDALRAGEQVGWSLVKEGQPTQGRDALDRIASALEVMPGQDLAASRVQWRIGVALWESGGDGRDEAHDKFITSLRINPSFPPAFTSLGIWYAEQASPPDEVRASKCYQKAFELDATEAEAAKRLAIGYAQESEWALVNTIAKRVIEGEGGLDGGLSGREKSVAVPKFLPTNAWAWKALGACQMVYKKYVEAAQCFQVALRVDDYDAALWIRLGEAYSRSGRHVAAVKALERGIEMDAENWLPHYHLGNVYKDLLNYDLAAASYRRAAQLGSDKQSGIIVALALTLLTRGRQEQLLGFQSRACETYIESLNTLTPIVDDRECRHSVWKLIAEACLHLSSVCRSDQDVNDAIKAVKPAFSTLVASEEHAHASVEGVASPEDVMSSTASQTSLAKAAVCAFAWRAYLLRYDERVAEPPLFDLASALHHLAKRLPPSDAATQAANRNALLLIRKALETDPSSSSLWNVFGLLAKAGNMQLSQHAFIVSLELEPRDPAVWCNLGFLYLDLGDPALAFQVFYKAQTLDPENPIPWLGQAMTAEATGNHEKAENLFAHATTLSSGSLLPAGLGVAKKVIENAAETPVLGIVDDLHPVSFALSRYCDAYPTDSSANILFAIISERLSQFDPALRAASAAVAQLEADYEQAESTELEGRYAVALLTRARLQLADNAVEDAVTSFNECINLLLERSDAEGITCRAQARLGLAISLSQDPDSLEGALEAFEASINDASALEESKGQAIAEAASVSLARCLWSLGDEDALAAAQTHLLECFAKEGNSVTALTTLASIGLLNGDEDVVTAISAEIDALDDDFRRDQDPSARLSQVESLMALEKGDIKAARSAFVRAVAKQPMKPVTRINLAQHLARSAASGDKSSIVGLLTGVQDLDGASLANIVQTDALLAAIVDEKHDDEEDESASTARALAQRAAHYQPWSTAGWSALAALET